MLYIINKIKFWVDPQITKANLSSEWQKVGLYLCNVLPAAEPCQTGISLWCSNHRCLIYESYNAWHDLLWYRPSRGWTESKHLRDGENKRSEGGVSWMCGGEVVTPFLSLVCQKKKFVCTIFSKALLLTFGGLALTDEESSSWIALTQQLSLCILPPHLPKIPPVITTAAHRSPRQQHTSFNICFQSACWSHIQIWKGVL